MAARLRRNCSPPPAARVFLRSDFGDGLGGGAAWVTSQWQVLACPFGGKSLQDASLSIGGKSLAERFFTGARCAISGFCPSAAVEGHRVSFSTCTKQDGVARGQLNVSCLIGHERARSAGCAVRSVVRALT